MFKIEPLKIVVEGTRGKSSLVRYFHECFYKNGFNVLSRETGLVPMIYYNDKKTFVKREGEVPFNLMTEAKVIMDMYSEEDIDVIIFENNAIREEYMRSLNDYLHADVVIITTITFDHILAQGFSMEETAETFIKSVPPYSHIIFWTNHYYEYEVFKKVCNEMNIKEADIIYSSLDERETKIQESMKKFCIAHGREIRDDYHPNPCYVYECPLEKADKPLPPEIFSDKLGTKKFVDIGHVNDPIHTYMISKQILSETGLEKVYLLFNFREDRVERIPLFLDGFLPLLKDSVAGIIVHSNHVAFSPGYLIKYMKKNVFDDPEKIKFYSFKDFDEFKEKIIPEIPDNSIILMVANTADKFGYELIDRLHLFRESYPILYDIDLFELRYNKKLAKED